MKKTSNKKRSKSNLSTVLSGNRRKCFHHPLVELDRVCLQQQKLKKKVYYVGCINRPYQQALLPETHPSHLERSQNSRKVDQAHSPLSSQRQETQPHTWQLNTVWFKLFGKQALNAWNCVQPKDTHSWISLLTGVFLTSGGNAGKSDFLAAFGLGSPPCERRFGAMTWS